MFQVEHLVVDDVFEYVARDAGMVEDSADNNGVMSGIVVAQNASCLGLAPAHSRTGHEAVEEASVQVFEDRVEIVEVAARRAEQLAATHLADQMGFSDDFMAGDIL